MQTVWCNLPTSGHSTLTLQDTLTGTCILLISCSPCSFPSVPPSFLLPSRPDDLQSLMVRDSPTSKAWRTPLNPTAWWQRHSPFNEEIKPTPFSQDIQSHYIKGTLRHQHCLCSRGKPSASFTKTWFTACTGWKLSHFRASADQVYANRRVKLIRACAKGTQDLFPTQISV